VNLHKPFFEIINFMKELSKREIKTGIITTKGKIFAEKILKELKNIGISKVTLFADAEVVSFYKKQGWILEPKGSKCAFWYAN